MMTTKCGAPVPTCAQNNAVATIRNKSSTANIWFTWWKLTIGNFCTSICEQTQAIEQHMPGYSGMLVRGHSV